jgi:Zn-dependent protease
LRKRRDLVNLLHVVFNLLPLPPMDGGRIVTSACCRTSWPQVRADRTVMVSLILLGLMLLKVLASG